MPRDRKIQIRRGTAAEWTSADPTLAEGELGYETDTGKGKFGDGTTAWTSLSYVTNWGSGGGGGGEANTASNLGGGEGLFTSKSGVDLPFKSLTAGSNVTLTASGTEIEIAAGGGVTDHGALAGLLDNDHPFYLAFVQDAEPTATYTGQLWYDTDASSGAVVGNINTITSNTTLDDSYYTVLCDTTSNDITITLPAALTAIGRQYNIKKISLNHQVIIDGDSTEEIDGAETQIIAAGTGLTAVTVQSNGTAWWVI